MSTVQAICLFLTISIAVVMIFGMCIVAIKSEERKDRQKAEIKHAERMKALELGRVLPEDMKKVKAAQSAAVGLGVGTASTTFAMALAVTVVTGMHETPWIAAAGVSIVSVISGTILAFRQPQPVPQEPAYDAKPAYDPDAYDVVGRRG